MLSAWLALCLFPLSAFIVLEDVCHSGVQMKYFGDSPCCQAEFSPQNNAHGSLLLPADPQGNRTDGVLRQRKTYFHFLFNLQEVYDFPYLIKAWRWGAGSEMAQQVKVFAP